MKAAIDSNDPTYVAQLEKLIAVTSKPKEIERVSTIRSYIEEGYEAIAAR